MKINKPTMRCYKAMEDQEDLLLVHIISRLFYSIRLRSIFRAQARLCFTAFNVVIHRRLFSVFHTLLYWCRLEINAAQHTTLRFHRSINVDENNGNQRQPEQMRLSTMDVIASSLYNAALSTDYQIRPLMSSPFHWKAQYKQTMRII